MAYLRGGTFVDGKLYVQDAIIVNRIQTPDGRNLPYLNIENTFSNGSESNSAVSFLASYSTTDGGLDNSPISYSFSEDTVTLAIVDSNKNLVTTDKITLSNTSADITLGADGRTWEFK